MSGAALYPYYEQELLFFRQFAQEFAKKHPGVAQRLQLEANRSTDPHVERLIESFAFLTARVHKKLDDEFPELTDALLNVIYPHYLAPIPSMAIIQLPVDPSRVESPIGFAIDRHASLHSKEVDHLQCQFRTAYPVTLWPIEVTSGRFRLPPFDPSPRPPAGTAAAIRLELECQGATPFAGLELDTLRFYLSGDSQVMATLYELIFNHTIKVAFRTLDRDTKQVPIFVEPGQCLGQVGFEPADGILPYSNQSFLGYRLLTEFFTFPSKFLFVDVKGLKKIWAAGVGRKIEIVLFLDRTMDGGTQAISADTFRLGCTPIVNLFEKTTEPIPLTPTRYEYRILPDVAHPMGMEVYSVDAVRSINPTTGKITEYHPFFSFRHGRTRENHQAFWFASRRHSLREGDAGIDVYLNVVNLDFQPDLPAEPTLVVRTTCTNRDLPITLQRAGGRLGFEMDMMAPLKMSGVQCLLAPTSPLRPPLQKSAHWRLISHLSLNHLSLSDPQEGLQALKEILRLYDFSDPINDPGRSDTTRHLIDGITSMNCRPVVGRVGGSTSGGFARGIEVTLELNEEKYIGTGAFLFTCILERFLGMYVSINSFSQLRAGTTQRGFLKKWPPRAGAIQLL
jgi:type VI secretion system protein ImpG